LGTFVIAVEQFEYEYGQRGKGWVYFFKKVRERVKMEYLADRNREREGGFGIPEAERLLEWYQ
jgi:hypothetical protein